MSFSSLPTATNMRTPPPQLLPLVRARPSIKFQPGPANYLGSTHACTLYCPPFPLSFCLSFSLCLFPRCLSFHFSFCFCFGIKSRSMFQPPERLNKKQVTFSNLSKSWTILLANKFTCYSCSADI